MLFRSLEDLDINWKDAIDKARKETFRWKGIKTSVFGRVNIVKTCILSKFNHIAAIIPQPNKELMKQIENIIVGFINNSKRHVYPKELMFTPKELGGLGLPIISDFWMALATSWFKRIPTSKSFWLTLLGEKSQNKAKLALHSIHLLFNTRDSYQGNQLLLGRRA